MSDNNDLRNQINERIYVNMHTSDNKRKQKHAFMT